MSRHGLHRVRAQWPIAAAGLLLVLLPGVAWADNCGTIPDCFSGAGAAITVATTSVGVAVWVFWNGFGSYDVDVGVDEGGHWRVGAHPGPPAPWSSASQVDNPEFPQ